MVKIKVELENGDMITKDKPEHALGDVSVEIRGDSTVVANELSIALYEIFMENPNIVTKALDYCSKRIDKEIHKEEN